DLTIEATDGRERAQIAQLRNRLLGEHLGLSADRLTNVRSFAELIDSCSSQPRCLRELPEDGVAVQIVSSALIDPPQPLTPAFICQALLVSLWRKKWHCIVAIAAAF